MDTRFTPVSLAEIDQYYRIWELTPRHSLDYTLANLWGWEEYFGLQWQFTDSLCWIRQTRPEPVCWAPLGDWNSQDWPAVFAACFSGQERRFTRVPAELAEIWKQQLPGRIELEEDRSQWEYLYLRSDLENLGGKKFHKKKNLYNSYVKTYGEPDYRSITDDMVEAVLALEDNWCQWHECDDSPSLRAENRAITRVLTHWHHFRNMMGGYLLIEGKMVAFSVGEKLDSETLGVHFEKGLGGYKGVYQAMNLQFAKNAGAGLKWINRAQDMGEEGLRQAKMTYMPEDFLRKFRVALNMSQS